MPRLVCAPPFVCMILPPPPPEPTPSPPTPPYLLDPPPYLPPTSPLPPPYTPPYPPPLHPPYPPPTSKVGGGDFVRYMPGDLMSCREHSVDTASHLYVAHSQPPCGPCLVDTFWHIAPSKLKEIFGTREGFEICPRPFFSSDDMAEGGGGRCASNAKALTDPRRTPSARAPFKGGSTQRGGGVHPPPPSGAECLGDQENFFGRN